MVPLSESPVMDLLGVKKRDLEGRIKEVNLPGNLEGLFAQYVVGCDPALGIAWNVNCATEEWLVANRSDLQHYPNLSKLGFSLSLYAATAPTDAAKTFISDFATIRQRPPFPGDRISFAYQPVAFLGLALGAVAAGEQGLPFRAWLASLLDDHRLITTNAYQMLLYHYIRFVLVQEPFAIEDLRRYTVADELALVDWGIRRGAFRLVDPGVGLSDLHARVLTSAAVSDTTTFAASRAALIWSAVQSALVHSVQELVLSRNHVAAVLGRFEDALRRWRWDTSNSRNPICWPITSEREVQDIVWLILRSVFDDVVDEDTLPKFGHSTYRTDFGIPSLRLLVEVKYARQASGFKELEKEILEDSVAYLAEAHDRYDRILVFIYDHSASVQEHGVTTNALRGLPSIEDVVIVSRPSHLPSSHPAVCGKRKRLNS